MPDFAGRAGSAWLPLLVFVGSGAAVAVLLVGADLDPVTARLLAAGGIALGAAGLSAWLIARRVQREEAEALAATAGELADLFGGESSTPERQGGSRRLAIAVRESTRRARERLGRLEDQHEHLLTVLGSMSEGVLVADGRGRTLLVNESWRALFGVTGEVEGRTALELTRQTALDRLIEDTIRTGVGKQIELEVTRGRRLTVILTSSPLTDGAGVVVLANDLTPFLRVGEIRRDFVANVSHELKTPLSAIRGFAETLADGALDNPEAATRFIERILRQCERLEALLSDLLTLSRLEHPAARSDWTEVDMAEVLHEAIDLTREAAAERRLDVSTEIERVRLLPGDTEAMVRMCLNLLENAIKYNRAGGRVAVRLRETVDAVVLEVADTGIGIPSEFLQRLFERFYRVDKGRSRDEGGTGLGLAIVKHAAQLHGGKVEVESEPGQGTTVRVTLPTVL